MFTDVFEEDTKVEEMVGLFDKRFDSLDQRGHSKPLDSILNKLINKLTLTLQHILIHLPHKGIHHLPQVDNNLIQQRQTIVLIRISLANHHNDVHTLVDIGRKSLRRVITQVAD